MKRIHTSVEAPVFLPTAPYLWQVVSEELTKIGIETKTELKLKKSIGALPEVLKPLWGVTATPKTILQGKLLFIQYAQKTGLSRKIAESQALQQKYGVSRNTLRSQITTWFVEQSAICEELLANAQSVTLQDEFLGLSTQAQTAIQENNITIPELLLMQPTIFYKIMGM